MTTTTDAFFIRTGDRIIVPTNLAQALDQEGLAGTIATVTSVLIYNVGRTVGITLEGHPEMCATPGAPIEVLNPDAA